MEIRAVRDAAELEDAIAVAGAAQAPGDHMPPDDWRCDAVRQAFPADGDVDLVAVDGAQVVGAALAFRDEGGVRVRVLGVDERHRGTGVGAALMNAVVKAARVAGDERVHLGSNHQSAGFHRRLGFTVCGQHATGLVFEKRMS